MNRREFLIQCAAAAVAIPAAMLLAGCGGGGGGGGGTPAPASSAGFSLTSTADQTGHNHAVTILFADLTSQPAAGVTYTTSAGGSTAHTHTLHISQAELNDINSGRTDRISTSIDLAHSHEFSITKPA